MSKLHSLACVFPKLYTSQERATLDARGFSLYVFRFPLSSLHLCPARKPFFFLEKAFSFWRVCFSFRRSMVNDARSSTGPGEFRCVRDKLIRSLEPRVGEGKTMNNSFGY